MRPQTAPAESDIVVRPKKVSAAVAYFVGMIATPDQFQVPTREEAVSQALEFAKRQKLRVWFMSDKADYELLGDFHDT